MRFWDNEIEWTAWIFPFFFFSLFVLREGGGVEGGADGGRGEERKLRGWGGNRRVGGKRMRRGGM